MPQSEEITNTNALSGLALAKYVLGRFVTNHESVEEISKDFDNDTMFISDIVDFLIDIRWMTQDKNGDCKRTRKGRTNTIVRHSPVNNFNRPYI
jgi:hypothetical protein